MNRKFTFLLLTLLSFQASGWLGDLFSGSDKPEKAPIGSEYTKYTYSVGNLRLWDVLPECPKEHEIRKNSCVFPLEHFGGDYLLAYEVMIVDYIRNSRGDRVASMIDVVVNKLFEKIVKERMIYSFGQPASDMLPRLTWAEDQNNLDSPRFIVRDLPGTTDMIMIRLTSLRLAGIMMKQNE